MKMILKHFEPKKTYSWKKLDELTGQKKGKWTWSADMMMNLAMMGYDLICIDPFDYKEFVKKGKPYLREIWTKEIADAQIKYSDIPHVIRSFRKLPKDFDWKMRDATMGDIKNCLRKGYLVETGINARIVNGKEGYAGHSVVIYACDKTHVYLHDPGLPPMPSRKIAINLFKKAWHSRSILAVKKARNPEGSQA